MCGRPPLDVEYLRGLRFSWIEVAEILGVSWSTLYRRLEQEGIERGVQYTSISDYDLGRAD